MTWLLGHLFAILYWLAMLGGLAWWAHSMRRQRVTSVRARTPDEDAELARLHSRLQLLRAERETNRG